MIQRIFDIIFSITGLIILFPLQIIIALAIKIDSKGPVLFKQKRVGKQGKLFNILKFRSMENTINPENSKLTLSDRDSRITRTGYIIRKLKLDEIPQLLNVLAGQMSIVGPRPEVPEYVSRYTAEEKKVLEYTPGITDWASIIYMDENEILANSQNPEQDYLNIIMREKLKLNMYYLNNYSPGIYLKLIWITMLSLFGYNYPHQNILNNLDQNIN